MGLVVRCRKRCPNLRTLFWRTSAGRAEALDRSRRLDEADARNAERSVLSTTATRLADRAGLAGRRRGWVAGAERRAGRAPWTDSQWWRTSARAGCDVGLEADGWVAIATANVEGLSASFDALVVVADFGKRPTPVDSPDWITLSSADVASRVSLRRRLARWQRSRQAGYVTGNRLDDCRT